MLAKTMQDNDLPNGITRGKKKKMSSFGAMALTPSLQGNKKKIQKINFGEDFEKYMDKGSEEEES